MPRGDPREHPCETCDDPSAPWGFTVLYDDDDGRAKAVTLWFCTAHKADGERLKAISDASHAPGALLAATTRRTAEPEPPPSQGSLDL